MIDALKASWDHLPKKPRLPPSLFSLKSRKVWLNVKPTFTYGDERDKLQRENARRAKKELARDEAWILREKKRKERERERERKKAEREAKREELRKAKAAGKALKSPVKTKPTMTTRAIPKVRVPTRSASMPTRAKSPQARPTPRVVYTLPTTKPTAAARPVQRSQTVPARPKATRQATVPAPRRVVVQPWGPIASSTARPGAPPVVRSQTQPIPRRR